MLIKNITQRDQFSFTIEWTDGLIQTFQLSDVQRHCPCIACREIRIREGKNLEVHEKVMAVKIKSMGRFAIKIDFTSGCSKGIYSFSLLRRIGT